MQKAPVVDARKRCGGKVVRRKDQCVFSSLHIFEYELEMQALSALSFGFREEVVSVVLFPESRMETFESRNGRYLCS